MRRRAPESAGERLLAPAEAKRVKKGMSRRTKILLASGLAVGAAAVGGVVAKQRFDALAPLDKIDVANRMIRGTDWFPWLSGRIRGMRDARVLAELNNPNAGANLTPFQRYDMATRVAAATADSPAVSAAVTAKRDAAVRQGVTDFSENARTWFRSFGSSLGGNKTAPSPAPVVPSPAPKPKPLPLPKKEDDLTAPLEPPK